MKQSLCHPKDPSPAGPAQAMGVDADDPRMSFGRRAANSPSISASLSWRAACTRDDMSTVQLSRFRAARPAEADILLVENDPNNEMYATTLRRAGFSRDAGARRHPGLAAAARASAASRRDRSRAARDGANGEREQASGRIRADYHEMPGLRLTVAQGARLWHLAPGVCQALLDDLVTDGLLIKSGEHYRMP
jgi:hypothetical protein